MTMSFEDGVLASDTEGIERGGLKKEVRFRLGFGLLRCAHREKGFICVLDQADSVLCA